MRSRWLEAPSDPAKRRANWQDFAVEIDGVTSGRQDDETSMHFAARSGNATEIKKLISSGADVNARNSLGMTPLHLAAWYGDETSVGALLKRSADTTAMTQTGKTPLHMAAWMGHPKVIGKLVKHDEASLHVRDKTGETALHWAAWRGKVRSIDELLNWGADIEAMDDFCMTPLLLAAQGGKHRAIGKLMDRGADIYAVDEDGETALHWSAGRGNIKASTELLGRGAHIEAVDSIDRTPIHLASYGGYDDVALELIKHGADLGAADKMGLTALHLGAFGGHRGVVRLLLANGANVHAKEEDGMTPLHLAAFAGSRAVVKDLLDQGADAEERCRTGRNSPVHLAAKRGRIGALTSLLSSGASPESINNKDRTPLHVASKHGNLPAVSTLLESDAQVSPSDMYGNTPLDLAERGGHEDVAALLRQYGARADQDMKPSRRSRSSSPAKSPRGPIRSPRVAAYPWQGATRSPSTGNSSPRSGFGPYPYKDLASPPSPQRDGSPTRKPARARPARARSPTTEPLAVSDQIHDDQRGRRPVIEPDRRTPSRSPSPWRIHPGSPNSGSVRRWSLASTLPRHETTQCPACGAERDECPTCGGPSSKGTMSPRSPSPIRRSHPGAPRPRQPRRRSLSPAPKARQANRAGPTWAEGVASAISNGLPNFSASELKAATGDFSEANILGESDDAVTYYGELRGKPVAVRVLNPLKPEVKKRFQHQLMATSMVPHKNISRVEGLCLEESCIVYSYAPEGDLEARLARDNPDAPPLTWKDRFSLAYDVATGLDHLHSCCPEPILHSNLVPSSVLLDGHLNAVLAGVSKARLASEAHRLEQSCDGPSLEGDVAALGVLMLRLYSGDVEADDQFLIDHAEYALQADRPLMAADMDAGNWPHKAAMSFIDLALWCVQEDPINRQLGSMKLVINKLQRLVEIYSTKLPTVDKLTSSPLSVSIHPCTYPSTQVELDTY